MACNFTYSIEVKLEWGIANESKLIYSRYKAGGLTRL